jgi:hypothetical protein
MTRRALLTVPLAVARAADVVDVRKIWDAGAHNAFTDLIRFHGRWYCAFREAAKHVSPDGAIRIIASRDGKQWEPSALLKSDNDLRDPKLCLTPAGRMMLTAAAAAPDGHQTYAWFSDNGRDYSNPEPVGERGLWLWRVVWRQDRAYGIGYSTGDDRFVRLYRSSDGVRFEPHVDRLFDRDYPNESAIVFDSQDTAHCLLRRDRGSASAMLGRARPPYREWDWRDLGVRVGGPQMLLHSGRLLAATRLHNPVRTALSWIDPGSASFTEFLRLPSAGDTSYPGLVAHDELLWVSYYSSHEGKTAIYLAKVRI